jgi:RNase adaptor protein for sRNA GlmZ degradation
VSNYQSRGFKDLMVSFGCTGGQHRSVYLAEQLARHLRGSNGVEVILHHRELEKQSLEQQNLDQQTPEHHDLERQTR